MIQSSSNIILPVLLSPLVFILINKFCTNRKCSQDQMLCQEVSNLSKNTRPGSSSRHAWNNAAFVRTELNVFYWDLKSIALFLNYKPDAYVGETWCRFHNSFLSLVGNCFNYLFITNFFADILLIFSKIVQTIMFSYIKSVCGGILKMLIIGSIPKDLEGTQNLQLSLCTPFDISNEYVQNQILKMWSILQKTHMGTVYWLHSNL